MTKTVTYKLAECQAEREAAFKLVYDRYLDTRLIAPNVFGIRVTPFHLLDTTDVVLAVRRGKVLSTVSLIRDGDLGLQMEAIYAAEVRKLRDRNVRLAEVSCFATRSADLLPSETFDVFVNVVAFTIQLARQRRVQQLLIAVHPDHEPFYRRMLGFRRIGHERRYPAVRGNLAVACNHDFLTLDRQPYPLYDLVYEVPYDIGEPNVMSWTERAYFKRRLDRELNKRHVAA